MAQPKAQTLQERMGFSDPDLRTPEHDALMVNLDMTMLVIANSLIINYPRLQWLTVSKVFKTWEYPIRTGFKNSYVLGFADMKVDVFGTSYYIDGGVRYECDDGCLGTLFFEVKPKIHSVGEVIRQVRHYQTVCCNKGDMWVIASPDNRFRSIIEDQGIGFVEL